MPVHFNKKNRSYFQIAKKWLDTSVTLVALNMISYTIKFYGLKNHINLHIREYTPYTHRWDSHM